ncbi:MAG: YqiA/YcfP family alpha/beta fold hydrolase [Myxococcota bacterium]|nr:YqiA/YcfP family alpha/beta fold hydrolase [Myxococcota bacterium]
MNRCLFAHGFEGHNDGPKPRFLREKLGWRVTAPVMYENGWTLRGQTETLVGHLQRDLEIRWLIGSSFGGLAAIAAADMCRHRPLRLILLAPAFGFSALMETRLGQAQMDQWRRQGQLAYHHRGLNRAVWLPYQLWTETQAAESLCVHHPCVLIHGVQDETIPIAASRALATRSPSVLHLFEADDSHRLSRSLGLIAEAVNLFPPDREGPD